jgi:hypothetical protein
MKTKDSLYQLVHSLSKTEKRYFKVYSTRHIIGEENNYIVLFDLLDEMRAFDAELLRQRLAQAGIGGNHSALKAYLYKLILKAMRAFHAERSSRIRLRDLLTDAEFLIERGLYSQADDLLQKAKEDAQARGSLLGLLEIVELSSQRIMSQETVQLPERVDAVFAERGQIQAALKMEGLVAKTYLQVLARHRKHGHLLHEPQRSEVIALAESLAAAIDPARLTPLARTRYAHIRMLHAECLGDPQQVLAASRAHVAAWEEAGWLAAESPTHYRRALANLLAALFKADQITAFPEVLARLKSIPAAHHDDEAETFQNAAFYEFLYHLNRAALGEAARLVPGIKAGLDRYESKISKSREISFRFNICLLYFFMGQWSDALKWLNRLRDERPSEQRLDVQAVLRIFELILHYELDHLDLLENKLRAARRHFKQHPPGGTLIAAVLDFFAQLLKAPDPKALRSLMTALHTRLNASAHKGLEPGILECSLWLSYHLQGPSMPAVLQDFVARGQGAG